eukprot:TRINITY_DN18313_c0_g1_i7.p1 TRINITY_DN18313_c0_g1~~TRINITY_DN18313_c0_g1_i7.p1  ORF type:complete len:295 (+),score=49.27 TRINITY_DN18313_c0_g1_i7:177-1061(+)
MAVDVAAREVERSLSLPLPAVLGSSADELARGLGRSASDGIDDATRRHAAASVQSGSGPDGLVPDPAPVGALTSPPTSSGLRELVLSQRLQTKVADAPLPLKERKSIHRSIHAAKAAPEEQSPASPFRDSMSKAFFSEEIVQEEAMAISIVDDYRPRPSPALVEGATSGATGFVPEVTFVPQRPRVHTDEIPGLSRYPSKTFESVRPVLQTSGAAPAPGPVAVAGGGQSNAASQKASELLKSVFVNLKYLAADASDDEVASNFRMARRAVDAASRCESSDGAPNPLDQNPCQWR